MIFFFKYTDKVISDAGLSDMTKLIRCKSEDAACQFTSQSISLLHQDSNHSEEVSCQEVSLWFDKVKIGGYWVFDDTNWSSTMKAQMLLLEKGYKLIFTEKDCQYKVFTRNN